MHPYMYMGRNVPKEGKNREKVTFYFVDTKKLIYQTYKVTQSNLLVRTHMYARLPTAMLIFCCHRWNIFGERKQGKSEKNEEIPNNAGLKNVLFPLVSIDFQPLKSFNY